jgi:hypothetical protein
MNKYILPSCFLLCSVLVLYHYAHVPYGNENYYLLRLFSTYHPDFLENDWTFGSGAPEHFIFNHIFGLFTLFMPLEVVGWLGRIACWAAIIIVLLRLARHLGVGEWAGAAAILAWIGIGQSLVGGEWIFKGFEAKCVSYFLLFGAIVMLLEEKEKLGALLLGLSFSFHPGVGLWGGLATAVALPALNMTVKRIATFIICAGIGALPGAIALAPHLIGSVQTTQNDWAYLALNVMPYHLDPFSWPKREYFTLFLLWVVNGLYFSKNQSDRTVRFTFFFQSAVGAIFIIGIIWRGFGRYDLLQYFPFRIFPIITPLLFFLFIAKAINEHRIRDLGKVILYAWVLALLCLPNPIIEFLDKRHAISSEIRIGNNDLFQAFKWISLNTPHGAIGIMPPWRKDVWHISKRGSVVNYRTPLYHKLPEWRERVEKLVGPVRPNDTTLDLQRRYEALTERSIVELSQLYEAEFIVSRTLYSFQRIAQVGTYNIYTLKQ